MILYVLTVFLSAFLLFQVLLLAGYAYAHATGRVLSLRRCCVDPNRFSKGGA
jgi:hypothetical protein